MASEAKTAIRMDEEETAAEKSLKKCPFCGAEGILLITKDGYRASCRDFYECPVQPMTLQRLDLATTVTAWNSRSR